MTHTPASLTLRLLTMPGMAAHLGLERVLTFAGIRSQPCRPTRTALEVVAWLRALAFNLLSCFRARLPPEGRHLVEWARACELLRDTLVHGRRQETRLTPA